MFEKEVRELDTDIFASTVGAVGFTDIAKEELRGAQADTLVDTTEVFVASRENNKLDSKVFVNIVTWEELNSVNAALLVNTPDVTFNVRVSSGLDRFVEPFDSTFSVGMLLGSTDVL